jgi:pyridinium-3,5-bisthiocarboxylic acid mononucleotide nickel chelatase
MGLHTGRKRRFQPTGVEASARQLFRPAFALGPSRARCNRTRVQTLYLDIFSGISGDMFLGALLDLGVDFRALQRELGKLKLDGYHLHAERRHKSSLEGVKFDVHLSGEPCEHHDHQAGHSHAHAHPHDHGHGGHGHRHGDSRDFAAIRTLIEASALSPWVKERAVAVFRRVAVAEGKVHGLPPERVHFHEVGAVDSIVDIVGACVALELLGRPRVLSGPVVEGTGFVNCAHGRFPIPTTATLEILGARGVAVTQCEEPHELVTPTGAALLAEFAERFGPMTGLVANRVGYGLGARDNRTRPNVLRAVLAATPAAPVASHDWETDTVAVLETNLDDCPGEWLGHVLEKALRHGALDAFHTPVQMKKNRPGTLLTLLAPPELADDLTALLLTETGAFGVRRTNAERRKLRREAAEVKTEFGTVKVKLGRLDGRVLHVTPEFESARDVAAQAGVPLKEVYAAVARDQSFAK